MFNNSDIVSVALESPGTFLAVPLQMEDTEPEEAEVAEVAEATLDTENNQVKFKKTGKDGNAATGKEACLNCAKLEEKLRRIQEDSSRLLNDTIRSYAKTTEELKSKIRSLVAHNEHVEELYTQTKQRSDAITATMADVFESKGELENVNDEFSNTKLAKRFEGIYNYSWTSLTEWFDDNIAELDELNRIKHLTALMKKAYEICASIADNEIRVFLVIKEWEPIPSSRDDPLLYKVRRCHGQTERKRDIVKKNVWQMLRKEHSVKQLLRGEQNGNCSTGIAKLEDFFNEFVDTCWLIAISHPKLLLNFDVLGKMYEGSIKDRFRRYSCQDTVKDMSKVKDTILEVVWPCVELEDGSGIHAKGDIIVVEEGSAE
ncbi:uncharacterized protein LOC123529012 isoform X2 [Mercenaria mercenaria]|uniref:uncharacterized protein LOC123529012 isoform X2 n=1 Tax=Mercenaria mercenaria TaxID=6596 RepID=UPI00234F13D2|nr:uncharacterized protein LOC123529012 isoform X2 [Mercenaria mercenaria]